MPRPDPLVTAYLSAYPDEASACFSRLTTAQAAEIWESLPETLAAPLLNRISPPLRDAIFSQANDARLAACINQTEPDEALRIVRALPKNNKQEVLGQVDQHRRTRLERTARQQEGSVGSAMSNHFVRLATNLRIDQAIKHIRSGQVAGPICALDGEGRLVGVIDPAKLLSSEQSRETVASLVERVSPLPAAMRLENAVKDSQWRDRLWLPVADRNRRLLGVLHRERLDSTDVRSASATVGVTPVIRTFVSVMGQVIAAILGG